MRSPMARSSRISSGSTSRVPGDRRARGRGLARDGAMLPVTALLYAGTRSAATRSMRAPSDRSRSSIRS